MVKMTRFCVLLTFNHEDYHPRHPVIFADDDHAEAAAIEYAEIMATLPHVKEVEVFRSHGFYKIGNDDD
jgi:hypothetical protein